MKLSPDSIYKHLSPLPLVVETYDVITSTNTVLKERGRQGTPHGLVIAAAEQTAGRGRMGRSFFSPAETGIYFSVLLRPKLPPQDCQLITTAAAVSCARVLEKFSGDTAQIKWVNDIYIKDKKVCGILTEASITPDGDLDFAVLGIGINITPPQNQFPDEIKEKAGSVLSHSVDDLRGQIIAEVLNEFFTLYNTLEDRAYFDEYRSRSMLDGKAVEVIKNDRIHPATALGIDEELRLVVKYSDGSVEHLYTGDVSIKKL
ncbi:MAG: biotin--[Oscillospiraceae bacterium]|nr:biotin--[acetyl-CoA-carboxylase] ligase [Oscillospiraceae bacterium]